MVKSSRVGKNTGASSAHAVGNVVIETSDLLVLLKLNAVVRRERIESIKDLKVDVVTARALKPLTETLKYAKPLMKNDSICLLLKGKRATEELTQAKKYWTFDIEIHPSRSDDSGKILILKNLRRGR